MSLVFLEEKLKENYRILWGWPNNMCLSVHIWGKSTEDGVIEVFLIPGAADFYQFGKKLAEQLI